MPIDHVGYEVSDYERAKAAYAKALAPLGYTLIMEVPAEGNPSGAPAVGFGIDGKPDFWIGGGGKLEKPLHVALTAKDRQTVDAFHKAALAAGFRDNGRPGLRPQYHAHYYAALSSISTATISRRSATSWRDRLNLSPGCSDQQWSKRQTSEKRHVHQITRQADPRRRRPHRGLRFR